MEHFCTHTVVNILRRSMRSFSSYHQKGYRRVSEIDLFRFSHFISTHSTFFTCPFRKREAKKQNQIGEEGVYTKALHICSGRDDGGCFCRAELIISGCAIWFNGEGSVREKGRKRNLRRQNVTCLALKHYTIY